MVIGLYVNFDKICTCCTHLDLVEQHLDKEKKIEAIDL